jgi:hypothetical protein
MIFQRIRAHFKGKRVEHQRATIDLYAEFLDNVYRRRFRGTDKARFDFLWCEIAEVSRVRPDLLHEDDLISDRCPGQQSWLSSDTRLDDLEYVIMTESQGRPPPKRRPQTIGDVLDYLLQNNDGKRGD